MGIVLACTPDLRASLHPIPGSPTAKWAVDAGMRYCAPAFRVVEAVHETVCSAG